jgi:hypothetical protein
MAAYVVYPTREQWQVLGEIIDALGEGGIIVPPDTAEQMRARGVTQEQLDGTTYLDDYDYGGDADLFVDVARPDNFAYMGLMSALSEGGADE